MKVVYFALIIIMMMMTTILSLYAVVLPTKHNSLTLLQ